MNDTSLKTGATQSTQAAASFSSAIRPGQTTGQLPADFKDLLAVLILGMGMSGGESQSGFSFGAGIAPLMLNLLEQLMAQQVQADSSPEAVTQAVSEQIVPAPAPPAGLPLSGRLTQSFHGGHRALDFGVPVGTPVHTTIGGKVVHAGWNDQGYGNLVIVENGPYRTYYAHLSEIPIEKGQVVQAGMVVGLSGNTGYSTGPHLHYEVRVNGQAVDPRNVQLP